MTFSRLQILRWPGFGENDIPDTHKLWMNKSTMNFLKFREDLLQVHYSLSRQLAIRDEPSMMYPIWTNRSIAEKKGIVITVG